MAKITEVADRMKNVRLKELRGIRAELTELNSTSDALIRVSAGLEEEQVDNMAPGNKELLMDTLGLLMSPPRDHPKPEYSEELDAMIVTLVHPVPNLQKVAVRTTGLGAVKDGMNSVTAIQRILQNATNITSPTLMLELEMGDVSRILEQALPTDLTDEDF